MIVYIVVSKSPELGNQHHENQNMKKLLILGGCLCLILGTLPAMSNPLANSALACFKHFLTEHSWAATQSQTWHFYPDGTVVEMSSLSRTLKQGQWSVQEAGEGLYLQLSWPNEEHFFGVNVQCDHTQIELSGVQPMTLNVIKAHPQEHQALLGDWQEGFSNNTPHLRFAADGSFQELTTNTAQYQITTGSWLISADGQFLLLHDSDGAIVQAYLVEHLQLDELVLMPLMKDKKARYLNKI